MQCFVGLSLVSARTSRVQARQLGAQRLTTLTHVTCAVFSSKAFVSATCGPAVLRPWQGTPIGHFEVTELLHLELYLCSCVYTHVRSLLGLAACVHSAVAKWVIPSTFIPLIAHVNSQQVQVELRLVRRLLCPITVT